MTHTFFSVTGFSAEHRLIFGWRGQQRRAARQGFNTGGYQNYEQQPQQVMYVDQFQQEKQRLAQKKIQILKKMSELAKGAPTKTDWNVYQEGFRRHYAHCEKAINACTGARQLDAVLREYEKRLSEHATNYRKQQTAENSLEKIAYNTWSVVLPQNGEIGLAFPGNKKQFMTTDLIARKWPNGWGILDPGNPHARYNKFNVSVDPENRNRLIIKSDLSFTYEFRTQPQTVVAAPPVSAGKDVATPVDNSGAGTIPELEPDTLPDGPLHIPPTVPVPEKTVTPESGNEKEADVPTVKPATPATEEVTPESKTGTESAPAKVPEVRKTLADKVLEKFRDRNKEATKTDTPVDTPAPEPLPVNPAPAPEAKKEATSPELKPVEEPGGNRLLKFLKNKTKEEPVQESAPEAAGKNAQEPEAGTPETEKPAAMPESVPPKPTIESAPIEEPEKNTEADSETTLPEELTNENIAKLIVNKTKSQLQTQLAQVEQELKKSGLPQKRRAQLEAHKFTLNRRISKMPDSTEEKAAPAQQKEKKEDATSSKNVLPEAPLADAETEQLAAREKEWNAVVEAAISQYKTAIDSKDVAAREKIAKELLEKYEQEYDFNEDLAHRFYELVMNDMAQMNEVPNVIKTLEHTLRGYISDELYEKLNPRTPPPKEEPEKNTEADSETTLPEELTNENIAKLIVNKTKSQLQTQLAQVEQELKKSGLPQKRRAQLEAHKFTLNRRISKMPDSTEEKAAPAQQKEKKEDATSSKNVLPEAPLADAETQAWNAKEAAKQEEWDNVVRTAMQKYKEAMQVNDLPTRIKIAKELYGKYLEVQNSISQDLQVQFYELVVKDTDTMKNAPESIRFLESMLQFELPQEVYRRNTLLTPTFAPEEQSTPTDGGVRNTEVQLADKIKEFTEKVKPMGSITFEKTDLSDEPVGYDILLSGKKAGHLALKKDSDGFITLSCLLTDEVVENNALIVATHYPPNLDYILNVLAGIEKKYVATSGMKTEDNQKLFILSLLFKPCDQFTNYKPGIVPVDLMRKKLKDLGYKGDHPWSKVVDQLERDQKKAKKEVAPEAAPTQAPEPSPATPERKPLMNILENNKSNPVPVPEVIKQPALQKEVKDLLEKGVTETDEYLNSLSVEKLEQLSAAGQNDLKTVELSGARKVILGSQLLRVKQIIEAKNKEKETPAQKGILKGIPESQKTKQDSEKNSESDIEPALMPDIAPESENQEADNTPAQPESSDAVPAEQDADLLLTPQDIATEKQSGFMEDLLKETEQEFTKESIPVSQNPVVPSQEVSVEEEENEENVNLERADASAAGDEEIEAETRSQMFEDDRRMGTDSPVSRQMRADIDALRNPLPDSVTSLPWATPEDYTNSITRFRVANALPADATNAEKYDYKRDIAFEMKIINQYQDIWKKNPDLKNQEKARLADLEKRMQAVDKTIVRNKPLTQREINSTILPIRYAVESGLDEVGDLFTKEEKDALLGYYASLEMYEKFRPDAAMSELIGRINRYRSIHELVKSIKPTFTEEGGAHWNFIDNDESAATIMLVRSSLKEKKVSGDDFKKYINASLGSIDGLSTANTELLLRDMYTLLKPEEDTETQTADSN